MLLAVFQAWGLVLWFTHTDECDKFLSEHYWCALLFLSDPDPRSSPWLWMLTLAAP